jgi:hypothetical protein
MTSPQEIKLELAERAVGYGPVLSLVCLEQQALYYIKLLEDTVTAFRAQVNTLTRTHEDHT